MCNAFLGTCDHICILSQIKDQHYPPGTQENYNSFSSRNLIMGKGKGLEFPEGWGGGRSSQSELNLMALRAIEARGSVTNPQFPLLKTSQKRCLNML
jgi:hypothetical protein